MDFTSNRNKVDRTKSKEQNSKQSNFTPCSKHDQNRIWSLYDNMTQALSLGVFIAFKGTHFCIVFAVTAAGVVPCGGPKSSRTSSIVQIIFHFWSFEISWNILRI